MGRLSLLGLVACIVAVFAFGQAEWQRHTVAAKLSEVLDPQNDHSFRDRPALEKQLLGAVEEVVGIDEDNPVEVYLYHFQPTVHKDEVLSPQRMPKAGGVVDIGEKYRFSVLVARVWWPQKILFAFNRWTFVTESMVVEANKVGSSYDTPDGDLEFVLDPSLVIDALR